jgi:signal transduction histidine kinase
LVVEHFREKSHRLRMAARAVVVLMVVVLSLLAVFFWVHSERVAVSQFNRTSLVMARLGSKRIEELFHRLERRLLVLARTRCDDREEVDCPLTPEEVLTELKPMGAVDILYKNAQGAVSRTLVFSPESIAPVLVQLADRCKPDPGPCFGIVDPPPAVKARGPLALFCVGKGLRSDCQTSKRVVAVFEWETLGRRLTEEVALDPQSLAWIIDEQGVLMYHPTNPEVCNEGVQRTDDRCQVCHKDSIFPGKMLKGGAGTGLIHVEGSVPKLVAFAPMHFAGQRWTLAVAVPHASVVAENRQVLILAILISAALIGLLLLVTYFLARENIRQITILEQNQETIHGLNADLETKVRERTNELQRLYDEIADFRRKHENRERLAIVGELAAVVAHEIRTPLNSLGISSERLARRLKTKPGENTQDTAEMVQSQIFEIRRINDYIEEYLKLARIPRRKVVRSDLNKLIQGLIKVLEEESRRLGVKLHFEASSRTVVAEVDEEQIRQVLLNLIINAFQAMPGGGDLYAEARTEDDHLIIRIRDTGVGIAKDRLVDVFKPFFTTREGGTGLGLAICARIVQEHKGSLVCESEVGNGTTFQIELPVVSPDAGPRESDGTGR